MIGIHVVPWSFITIIDYFLFLGLPLIIIARR